MGSSSSERRAAVFFQVGVPAADLLPGFERRQLNIGTVVIGAMLFLLFVFVLLVVFTLEMRTSPVINAAVVLFSDLGI